jgi:hypothetical protein
MRSLPLRLTPPLRANYYAVAMILAKKFHLSIVTLPAQSASGHEFSKI